MSKLLQFLQNLLPIHILAANQTLEYLVETKYLAIKFNRNQRNKRIFITLSNLAFIDDTTSRYSSYRFCFLLFSRLIYYKAVKRTIVTTLLIEAELLAILLTAKDFI